ncbi:MAG: DNA polymerase III subunit alpha [Gammaproteobacteria bacterium]|mgnify:CR=1 FL=1|jgi:DNA polymerase-3 subunit alpha|nr:DNA polymerase III subunit alpha [Gammaproteobacteria bacterium]MBT3724111.1 DNA polymerase III subunit alpha [Gammaproteobacteria bacterium]MBT4193918.1 DNA polymerase III subunit alpha [Gammaproteobacteria bacterium]MBT4451216.1 DNA polymerase III subunit alpha [Gammaproteobacteria bacterium]MBT4859840.1 DNA polymerase III subunit alpha [Gammaproteobacteria bacterium]
MPTQFVHLHVHSEFSLVDSTVRLKPLIGQVVERGMGAIALTDMSNMFALVKMFKIATAAGVKPIFGADVWIRFEDRPENLSKLVLLCQNDVGYLNLKRLISRSFQEGQVADRPTILVDWLEGNTEGLLCLSSGLEGDVGQAIRAQNVELAEEYLDAWQVLFPNRFFIELQRTDRPFEETYIGYAVKLSAEKGIPLVATNDVRFIDSSDFDSHEIRVCVCSGFTLDDNRRPKIYSEQQYLRSSEEMIDLFKDIPQAIENTVNIATSCNVTLKLGKNYLPEFPIPEGFTTDSYFRSVSEEGLEARMKFLQEQLPDGEMLDRQPYIDRLNIELDVIIQMGFPGYFLIVADFIEWSKDNDIPVGPGRGSGAGSVVAYALKITDLDPLEYELLFERFLNPERVSMPDFDIDFCMEKRDRVIEYVAKTYGRNQVSQIITYGTMAAKAVIRDVGRVLGHPYGFVDRIAKLIPFEIGMTLDKALEQEADLQTLYQEDEEVNAMMDIARSLEGLTRNVGKHAGGVVIAPGDLTDFTPIYCEQGGAGLVSQYDKGDVEDVGLVKFDFLGLRTLTIIDWALKAINKKKDLPLEIERIPLDDRASFDLLQAYQTTAVFQLESAGMKDLIRRLQPDSFEDIIALVALFRPGPLQSGMVDDFINRKHGRSKVEYPHPSLEPILQPTYGVILYQEQVMQIAQVLAKYTLGGADMLRRAMGKKKPEEMAKQRVIFTEGALNNDVDEETATGIFDLMEKFAGYGFNKSHSAAYALVSYQTAWLKAHYPPEFMAAVLSADMDNTDKVVILIEECRSMKLKVLPPDVNNSDYHFRANDQGEVIYGLGAIKGVGEAAIDSIINERKNGEYRSLDDFCERVDMSKANKKVMNALVTCGAMDCFSNNRAALQTHLPYALQAADQLQRNQDAGMVDMFAMDEPENVVKPLPDVPAWDEKTRLMNEKESLGLFLTGHPVDLYKKELRQIVSVNLGQWLQKLDTSDTPTSGFRRKDENAIVVGLVIGIRTRNAHNGREVFVTLDDRTGRIDVRVFPEMFQEIESIVQKDVMWVVEGGISYDDFNNGIRIRARKVELLETFRSNHARSVKIDLSKTGARLIDKLGRDLQPFQKNDCLPLVFHNEKEGYEYILQTENWRLSPSDESLLILEKHLGKDAFQIDYS